MGIGGANRLTRETALICGLGVLLSGFFGTSKAASIDRSYWVQAYTNFCLQETYSNPNAVEALYFVGQTANAICGCGGELIGATLTLEEAAFFSSNGHMRGDTKLRWRKGLATCMQGAGRGKRTFGLRRKTVDLHN